MPFIVQRYEKQVRFGQLLQIRLPTVSNLIRRDRGCTLKLLRWFGRPNSYGSYPGTD